MPETFLIARKFLFRTHFSLLLYFITVFASIFPSATMAQTTGYVYTYAGRSGNDGYQSDGNGGAAISAYIRNPSHMAADLYGNIFFSEYFSQVREISTSGIISQVAGTGAVGYGNIGYNGDSISAITAELSGPSGLAIDSANNIFIADGGNNRIRRVDASTGIITTIAGNGTASFGGDGGSAALAYLYSPTDAVFDLLGNLYIADSGNGRVRIIDSSGNISTFAGTGSGTHSGDGGAATSAGIGVPSSLAFDRLNNRIYILAYIGTWEIRAVDLSSGLISTVSNSSSGFGDHIINAITIDGEGNLFAAINSSQTVERMDASTGAITTVAGTVLGAYSGEGGPATSATFTYIDGLAVDGAGNLFISDNSSHKILEVYHGVAPAPALYSPRSASCLGAQASNLAGPETPGGGDAGMTSVKQGGGGGFPPPPAAPVYACSWYNFADAGTITTRPMILTFYGAIGKSGSGSSHANTEIYAYTSTTTLLDVSFADQVFTLTIPTGTDLSTLDVDVSVWAGGVAPSTASATVGYMAVR